tara:strand:+ start:416 stop:682 length:267 start_codon:yes stop_codon:yes gene_type:complete
MNNNKLIAEFMGDGKEYEIDINTKTLKSYHTSWDWLMPAVQKCFDTQQPEEGQHYFINESLLTMDIGVVYDRVVWFIQEYNLTPKEVV